MTANNSIKRTPPVPHPRKTLDPSIADTIREAAAQKCKFGIFPRTATPEMTGGGYSSGYMANLDSKGEGPECGFYIGRQKFYTVDGYIDWLLARAGEKS